MALALLSPPCDDVMVDLSLTGIVLWGKPQWLRLVSVGATYFIEVFRVVVSLSAAFNRVINIAVVLLVLRDRILEVLLIPK